MLKSDLLIYRQTGETIIPKRLPLDPSSITIAREQIECFQEALGKTQGYLDEKLKEQEADRPDYRILRGLAHLLKNSYSTFEIISPIPPQLLRQRVFQEAARKLSVPENRLSTLENISSILTQELNREVLPAEIEKGLYADLQENRVMTNFEAPSPEALINLYNLAQVQGIFYRASQIVINAHRNDPGEYKLLFRYLKLFQLMAYIEGDADTGFTITIDGPTSLFKANTRYGLALAKLVPALLHVTKWSLVSRLELNHDGYSDRGKIGRFTLNDRCGLVSHYPGGKAYDSMIEESFALSWSKLTTPWRLEREVDLIPLPGSVMIPDFRLVHDDGRNFLLEIVGYWRPEYLRKKFAQVRRSQVNNLILAISERLNLEKASVTTKDLPARIIWFKDKLAPTAVLQALENEN